MGTWKMPHPPGFITRNTPDHLAVVRHMLHELVAHDDVEVVRAVRNLMHVEMHIRPRRHEVRPNDLEPLSPVEPLQETVLRSEVEHPTAEPP